MNIQPTVAAAQVAGTSLAATKGGESDKRAADATQKQAAAESPDGKVGELDPLGKGDAIGDRGGDGRQSLDSFQRSSDKENSGEDASLEDDDGKESRGDDAPIGNIAPPPRLPDHIDFKA